MARLWVRPGAGRCGSRYDRPLRRLILDEAVGDEGADGTEVIGTEGVNITLGDE
jgi:hypothetical protein